MRVGFLLEAIDKQQAGQNGGRGPGRIGRGAQGHDGRQLAGDAVRQAGGPADDELRSINAQIEFLLRQALKGAGRITEQPRESE